MIKFSCVKVQYLSVKYLMKVVLNSVPSRRIFAKKMRLNHIHQIKEKENQHCNEKL